MSVEKTTGALDSASTTLVTSRPHNVDCDAKSTAIGKKAEESSPGTLNSSEPESPGSTASIVQSSVCVSLLIAYVPSALETVG